MFRARETRYANRRYGLNIRFVREETKSCPPKKRSASTKATHKNNPRDDGPVS